MGRIIHRGGAEDAEGESKKIILCELCASAVSRLSDLSLALVAVFTMNAHLPLRRARLLFSSEHLLRFDRARQDLLLVREPDDSLQRPAIGS
jgi:hypothetical protein